MQKKKGAVFVMTIANDHSQIPLEMLRQARWDAPFFVDLPNHAKTEAIWKTHISKYGPGCKGLRSGSTLEDH
jgi:SpoVK/Ycf46/Vps4 family AAA+-type ATPase